MTPQPISTVPQEDDMPLLLSARIRVAGIPVSGSEENGWPTSTPVLCWSHLIGFRLP